MNKNDEIKVRLSPSRISTFETCSWLYYQQYQNQMPNSDNDGSRRGTIVHGLLEHLAKNKHKHKVPLILHANDVFAIPSCARYLEIYAKKVGLKLDDKFLNNSKTDWLKHRELVSDMILVALKQDFFGDELDYNVEIITEQYCTFVENNDWSKYFIRGIIDKVFICRDKKTGKVVEIKIIDYKTSKSKFNAKKIAQNIQGLTYQFFGHKMYPDVQKISFEFHFLRFANPVLKVPAFKKENVGGFETYLTYVTNYLDDFGPQKARSNLAKFNGGHFLCGKGGFKQIKDKKTQQLKETSEPNWKCDFKDPFDYWAVVDADGNNIRTAFKRKELELTEEDRTNGFVIRKKRYVGCPAWHTSTKRVKKFLQI